ncbi:MAG: hypothetical protein EBZ67_10880, partial [Chitinophagia bacterium]|nr:hypothetical protein [Chitinophagia bacterium]
QMAKETMHIEDDEELTRKRRRDDIELEMMQVKLDQSKISMEQSKIGIEQSKINVEQIFKLMSPTTEVKCI